MTYMYITIQGHEDELRRKSLCCNYRTLVGNTLINVVSLVVYDVQTEKKESSRPTIRKWSCSDRPWVDNYVCSHLKYRRVLKNLTWNKVL